MKQRNLILLGLGVVVAGSLIFSSRSGPGQRAEAPATAPAPVAAPAPSSQPAASPSLPVPLSTPDTGRVPHFHKTAADAQPLPAIMPAERYHIPIVARAYRIAAKLREVIAQQPCYCFCDKMGHGSLLDCFTTDHGSGCAVCVKEVLLADQLTRKGKNATEIRAAIIRGDWERVPLEE